MFDYLLHLWAPPPTDLQLICPPPPPGDPPDLAGFFDPSTVATAYSAAGLASGVVVLLLAFVCFQFTSYTTGPRFTKRYVLFWLVCGVLCFLVPLAILRAAETLALAGTCDTNPEPFAQALPWNVIIGRGVAGLVWGALMFFVVTLLLTRTAGRFPWSGGFFHNRGTPWPRLVPGR